MVHWSAAILRMWCLSDAQLELKDLKCVKNISLHAITQSTEVLIQSWSADGSILLCCLQKILNIQPECGSRNRDSSDNATCIQSFSVQFL